MTATGLGSQCWVGGGGGEGEGKRGGEGRRRGREEIGGEEERGGRGREEKKKYFAVVMVLCTPEKVNENNIFAVAKEPMSYACMPCDH